MVSLILQDEIEVDMKRFRLALCMTPVLVAIG
jgi:hypothetical protein